MYSLLFSVFLSFLFYYIFAFLDFQQLSNLFSRHNWSIIYNFFYSISIRCTRIISRRQVLFEERKTIGRQEGQIKKKKFDQPKILAEARQLEREFLYKSFFVLRRKDVTSLRSS